VIRKLVLSALSLLLSAVAAEVALRLLGFHGSTVGALEAVVPAADPVVDFRMRPDSTWISRGLLYRTNHLGFRTLTHP
jgi:hypothetical protein